MESVQLFWACFCHWWSPTSCVVPDASILDSEWLAARWVWVLPLARQSQAIRWIIWAARQHFVALLWLLFADWRRYGCCCLRHVRAVAVNSQIRTLPIPAW